ncbi:MAG: flagellar biosynthesis anti-sigma factor FlgM [Bdellovibrionales bacterium]|nr:flagellar biosynthesis anti-sigma factor FlgM [Bdellovibrionales bacterium]
MSSESKQAEPLSERKRSLTSLTLAWISEKIRRSEAIKAQVRSGAYQVDNAKLAAALANEESE